VNEDDDEELAFEKVNEIQYLRVMLRVKMISPKKWE